MIKTKSLFELKKIPPTSEPVFVRSKKRIYESHGGEWIVRMYFKADEVADILSVPEWLVRSLYLKLGYGRRLTYLNVINIAKAVRIKQRTKMLRFKELKKIMKQ